MLEELRDAQTELSKIRNGVVIDLCNTWLLEPLVEWIEGVVGTKDELAAYQAHFLSALRENPPTGCGLDLALLTDRGAKLAKTFRKLVTNNTCEPHEILSAINVLYSWNRLVASASARQRA
jgi:hypothetical protein